MSVLLRCFILILAAAVVACASTSVRDKAADYLALRYAAREGDEALVGALLGRGTPVDPLDIDAAGELTLGVAEAESPLQIAAAQGNLKIVQMLLAHHPWIDRRCCDGPTALGHAAEHGYTEIAEILLEAGADPAIKSEFGTAIEIARRNGHDDTARVIEAATRRQPLAHGEGHAN
jgi:ankyrin repeat protein